MPEESAGTHYRRSSKRADGAPPRHHLVILQDDLDFNGRDDLVVDFGTQYGIWVRMNDAEWVHLHGTSTVQAASGAAGSHIAAADMDGNGQDDVAIDFGAPHGIWVRMNNANWVQLHGSSARSMMAADIDGNGKAEVVVDFGSTADGIWARMNNAAWSQVHGLDANAMSSGQIDGN